jgi:type IV pilus assembly protein PilQ
MMEDRSMVARPPVRACALFAICVLGGPALAAPGVNAIQKLDTREDGGTTVVTIRGTTTPTFTVYKLERPERVVIDVANARLGGDLDGPRPVNSWAVSQLMAQALGGQEAQTVRILVGFARASSYQVKAVGNDVVVTVAAREAKPDDGRALADQRMADVDRRMQEAEKLRAEAQKERAAAERMKKEAAEAAATAELRKAEAAAVAASAEKRKNDAEAAVAAAEKRRGEADAALSAAEKRRGELERAAKDAADRARVAEAAGAADAARKRKEAEDLAARADTQRREAEVAATQAEARRKEAEGKRGEAEARRKAVEAATAQAEARRVEAEGAKTLADTERKRAEAATASAEKERRTAEDAKLAAEREKRLAEEARDRAQSERGIAEAARTTAEAARRKQEERAAAVELVRQKEEQRTAAAAKARVSAEGAVAQAEQARADSETRRAETQAALAGLEQARARAETARKEAEARREKAERAAKAADALARNKTATEADVRKARADAARLDNERQLADADLARRKGELTSGEAKAKALEEARTRALAELTAAQGKVDAARKTLAEEEKRRADVTAARAGEEKALAEASRRRQEEEKKAQAAEGRRREAETAAQEAAVRAATEAAQVAAATQKATTQKAAAETAAERAAAELAARKAEAERASAEMTAKKAAAEKALAETEAKRLAVAAQTQKATKERAAAEAEAEKAAKRRIAAEAQAEKAAAELKKKTAAAEKALATAEAGRAAAEKATDAAAKKVAEAESKKTAAPTPAPVTPSVLAEARGPRPEAPPPANSAIRDIDYVDLPAVARVVIKLSGSAAPRLISAGDKQAILEVEAELPDRLERALDVRDYSGPIATVKSFRDRADPKKVRLVVDLASPAAPMLARAGDGYTIDFPKMVARGKPIAAPPPIVGGYAAATTPVAAQTVGQGTGKAVIRGRHIGLDAKDADIHNLMRLIAQAGNVDIIIPDDVKATVTVRLTNVPWQQAMEVILQSKGLWYRQIGNIIRVANRKDLDAEDQAERERLRALVQEERPEVEIFRLNYAKATEARVQAQPLLSPKGKVTIDERTNSVIVTDIAGNRRTIIALLRDLDTQTPQIQIEARVVEARSTWRRQVGIQWGFNAIASAATGNPTGLVFPSTIGVAGGNDDPNAPTNGLPTTTPNFAVNLPAATGLGSGGALGFTFGSLGGNFNVNLRLSAAEDTGLIRIISAPKITVLNGRQATISQGVSIPIQVVSAAGTMTQFVPADLELRAKPYVSPRDCSIVLEIDVTKNEADFANRGARGDPSILRKEAHTTMLISDGDTSVIGGVYTRNTGLSYAKVPWFAEIPIIGWFFKNRSENDERTEMLIFLTPRITNKASLRCETASDRR